MAWPRLVNEKAFQRGDAETGSAAAAERQQRFKINPVGMGLAFLGAGAMLVSVFLPRVESSAFTFGGVQQNTMIQSGSVGWILIGLAVLIAGSTYRSWTAGIKSWAPLVAGVIAIGAAYHEGTNKDRLTLYPVDQNGNPDTSRPSSTASPGVGIWVAGVGGALALLGGWQMRRDSGPLSDVPTGHMLTAAQTRPEPPPRAAEAMKRCPECAEAVLAAAKVCRYCGYRFEPAERRPVV